VIFAVAALLLVAGVVAYLQTRADHELAPTITPVQATQSKPEPTVKPGGKLDPAAKNIAKLFIKSTLARENLAQAWDLATPDLRSAVTKKQWLNGELPIPPFPILNLETTGFDLVGTAPNKILLEILLVPKLNSGYVPTRYFLSLVRKGKTSPWRVSYFLPYAPPGKYVEPQ
jgi:hypothetical protein